MSLFSFDEASHTYTYAGLRLPTVTEILGGGKPEFISQEKWDRAADFGTAVHSATAYFDRGVLDEKSVDPGIRGYVDAWIKCREILGIEKFIEIERSVYSLPYWYAGTVDRIFELHGKVIVCDLKTGRKYDRTGVQCAGYAMAYGELEGLYADEYWGVYLTGGAFDIVKYGTKEIYDLKWKSALAKFRTGATTEGEKENGKA